MMMRSLKRWVAVGLTAAVAAVGLEYAAPVVASAASVDLKCDGITGDNASSLGDSKATLGLLATLSPGSGSGLTFPVDITSDAPAKATPGAGPFTANFDLTLTLPDTVVKQAKDLLKLTTVKVTNATFAISASGAATAELTKSVPELTVDLTKSPVVVKQRITGTVDPKSSGAIIYRASPNTKMTIVIGGSVAGVTINSLSVTCKSDKEVGTTAVQIPGAPNITQPLYQVAWTASVVGRPLIGKDITPDNGNPITTDSLKLTSQAPNGGYSAVGGGAAFFLAPREPGLYNAQYQVCAASKTVPEVPGVNTVQTLSWPESYAGKGLNAHPISMALSFKGQKTKPIAMSFLNGQPTPLLESQLDFFQRFFSEFRAPAAGEIQAALESLSSVGKGNVEVSGGFNNAPYTITFKGALGLSDQPKIEIVDFQSWLPADGLAAVIAAIKPAPPGPGPTTTTTTPRTQEQLDALLATGQISFDDWLDGRLNLLTASIIAGATSPATITALTALFPKPPDTLVTVTGKPTVPQTETGPLCSAFTIGYFVIPNPNVQVLPASVSRVKKCTTARVKVKGKYVKKTTCKYVTVKTPAKKATTKKATTKKK